MVVSRTYHRPRFPPRTRYYWNLKTDGRWHTLKEFEDTNVSLEAVTQIAKQWAKRNGYVCETRMLKTKKPPRKLQVKFHDSSTD